MMKIIGLFNFVQTKGLFGNNLIVKVLNHLVQAKNLNFDFLYLHLIL